MDATKKNYYVDVFMGLIFLACLLTGAIQLEPLANALGVRSWPSFGLIMTIHELTSIAAVLIILIHVLLHWQWIVSITRSIFGKK